MADLPFLPALGDKIIDGGQASFDFYLWLESVNTAILNLQPRVGSGSPEGVVEAPSGVWYVDQSAPTGTGIYFKETGDGDTGWALRS